MRDRSGLQISTTNMAKKDNACDIAIVWSSLMYTLGEPYALYENVNHFIFGWKHFNFRLSIIYLDLNESTFSVRFPLLPVIVAMHLFSLPPPFLHPPFSIYAFSLPIHSVWLFIFCMVHKTFISD